MEHQAKGILILGLAIAAGAFLAEASATQDAVLPPYGLPVPPGVNPQTVCGVKNDLQDVETYDGNLGVSQEYVADHLGSTIRLQWRTERAIRKDLPAYTPGTVGGRPWCTGTLISDRMVLTAGHCFEPQNGKSGWTTPYTRDAERQVVFASDEQLARLQVAQFGYQINAETGIARVPRTFAIKRLVERVFEARGIDYAIIELAADQDGKFPADFVTPAKLASRTPFAGEKLVIIQHPQGEPKKVGTGTASSDSDPFVFYDNIDTLGASSGAGVRDEHGDIVGVHIRGGCETSANSAVSIVAIEGVSDAL